MLSKEASGAISHFVADILGGDAGSSDEGHHLIRKLAHFSEYAALGVISALFFDSLLEDRQKKCFVSAIVGILTPLVDETIQIFSGRGPAISDIWIDVLGYSIGALAVFFVIFRQFGRGPRGEKRE